MASFNDLSLQYRLRLEKSTNKRQEIITIIQEINNLVYTNNKLPLSYEDKVIIIRSIADLDLFLEHSEKQVRANANDEYLKLVDTMINLLEK